MDDRLDAAVGPAAPRSPSRANPVLWAMIGIPAVTVLASAYTLWLAFGDAEPKLPKRYAWEGAALERDIERAARAEAQGIAVTLEIAADGRITGLLVPAPTTPGAALTLHLTHATRTEGDRSVRLEPTGTPGRYEGRLAPLPAARWLVQLEDERGGWQLRGRLETPGTAVHLGHR